MGRAGRYSLSVMVWVVAYAGWSTLVGFVIAAIVGHEAKDVSVAGTALLTIVGPLVPTLAALVFNDWARDGFPTKEQRARGARAAAHSGRSARTSAVAVGSPAGATTGGLVTPGVVAPAPLGVPERSAPAPATGTGGFPVAPLLRD